MEANNFISTEEIQRQIQKLIAEKEDSVTFQSGKRVKITIVAKTSESYAQYENHLLQFDVTADNKVYAVICGAK